MKKNPFLRKDAICCILLFILFFNTLFAFSQSYKGKDGAKTYSSSGSYILNRYATLASSVSAGAGSIDVADITQLSGSYSFPNASNPYTSDQLTAGDLIMIIQMQGADISTANDASYGSITAYNNTGSYELKTVLSVSGNTISVCPALHNSYSESGRMRTQIVRVPRLSSLTIDASAIITGSAWNGATGGIVALEVSGDAVVNGIISADSIGFRGGNDVIDQSDEPRDPNSYYVTSDANIAASKGEGIAGNFDDYNNLLNGSYGRGAPANGGGGGNGHNSGGGGGSNVGFNNSLIWNGTGIKNTSTPSWSSAWELEGSGFSSDMSSGGGRGGYSFSYGYDDDDNPVYPDPLLLGPGDMGWYGDYRQNVGGLGGRPLEYIGALLFMGGGGGSGDGNDNGSGFGGNGGGIIYMLVNGNVSGTGSVSANGHNGYDTHDDGNDGAGGGGGGGAILMLANGTLSGISVSANGGSGGSQAYVYGESEGPGAGGGGGFIHTTATGVGMSEEALGGTNGITLSNQMENFLPDGATMGSDGTVLTASFADIETCSALPVTLINFTGTKQNGYNKLQWATTDEINFDHFELEKSTDGHTFTKLADIAGAGGGSNSYSYNDFTIATGKIYYRLKMSDKDGSFSYSNIIYINNTADNSITIYPNPSSDLVTLSIGNNNLLNTKAKLYDAAGQLIKTIIINHQQLQISINSLSRGMYLLKLKDGSAFKVIKE